MLKIKNLSTSEAGFLSVIPHSINAKFINLNIKRNLSNNLEVLIYDSVSNVLLFDDVLQF